MPRLPSPASRRGRVWLRAGLFSPLIILALALVAGEAGHPALPFDTLSGGRSPWLLGLLELLGFMGMAVFAISALLIYSLLIINGMSTMSGALQWPMLILAATLLGAYALCQYVDWKTRHDIARAGLTMERIATAQWQAQLCGRRRYICIAWQGSLGKAHIKGYISGPRPARDELVLWEAAHAAGQPLTIEWGKTPSGWIATKSATTGSLRFENAWP